MKRGMVGDKLAPGLRPALTRPRRKFNWRRFLAFLAVLYFVVMGGRALVSIVVVERQIQATEQALKLAKAQQAAYQQEIAYRQTDAYVEKVAREVLGMVKPGEVPYITVAPSSQQSTEP